MNCCTRQDPAGFLLIVSTHVAAVICKLLWAWKPTMASFTCILPLLRWLGQPGAHRLLCLPICSLDLRKWLRAPRGLRWELSGLQDSRPHNGIVTPFAFYGKKQFTRQSRLKRRHEFLMGGVPCVFRGIKNGQWPCWHRNSPSPPLMLFSRPRPTLLSDSIHSSLPMSCSVTVGASLLSTLWSLPSPHW